MRISKSVTMGCFVLGLAASAYAGQFKSKAQKGDWEIYTGTVTSVVEEQQLLTLAHDNGTVTNHLITKDTYVEKPQTHRKIEVSEVLTGDRVTLYVSSTSNVIGRIIYPMDVAVATMTSTSQTISASTPTTVSPVIGTVVTVANNYLTILKRDGGAATFQFTDQVPLDGPEKEIGQLPTNTRVKVWADENGVATRVSTQPSDVDSYF